MAFELDVDRTKEGGDKGERADGGNRSERKGGDRPGERGPKGRVVKLAVQM